MRVSRNQGCKSATHIVSGWADQNEFLLGQIKVEEKSNEMTSIPQLPDVLFLKWCVVTIDALGSQKKIARKIVAKKADYILAAKENQKDLSEDIKGSFMVLPPKDCFEGTNYGHGSIERRKYSISYRSKLG